MKYLKLAVLALVMAFTFGTAAEAQVRASREVGVSTYHHHGHWYHYRRAYYRGHHKFYRYYN